MKYVKGVKVIVKDASLMNTGTHIPVTLGDAGVVEERDAGFIKVTIYVKSGSPYFLSMSMGNLYALDSMLDQYFDVLQPPGSGCNHHWVEMIYSTYCKHCNETSNLHDLLKKS